VPYGKKYCHYDKRITYVPSEYIPGAYKTATKRTDNWTPPGVVVSWDRIAED
jgi:hypothetical protein